MSLEVRQITAGGSSRRIVRCHRATCPPSGTARNLKFLVAGAIAGVVSRTLVSPLEVVATMNMATVGTVEGPLDALSRLWASEGVVGLYKGNGANCLKVAPTKGIQFVSFEFFKRQI